jgi:NADH-quinone oxidoreductase subunit C
MEKRCFRVGVMGVNIVNYVYKIVPNNIYNIIIEKGYILININKKQTQQIMYVLSKSLFILSNSLIDLFGVDYPIKRNRFQVNYYLLSVMYNIRLLVRVTVFKEESLMTITNIYKSGGWLEREVWDMYGIFFNNNLDLRRILTDYGFEGFPLRKDYPLLGFFQIRFDMEASHVVYERVNVAQELRMFEYLSPWRI